MYAADPVTSASEKLGADMALTGGPRPFYRRREADLDAEKHFG